MEGSNGLCICVVGLGYVGLPLAVEFGRVFDSVGYDMDVYDPVANVEDVMHNYGIELINIEGLYLNVYDAVVLTVAHDKFREIDIRRLRGSGACVVYDVKGFFDARFVDGRL
ncbi:MAG: hypothetical protein J7L41_04375 [Synergistetes bacterium]|nr:hypothetical protein [Synergistota bacterium]